MSFTFTEATNAMERKLAEPTFTDAWLDYGSPRMAAFFAEMDAVVPWADVAASIADVFDDDSDSDKGGRPHWPVVLMVKCLMLQKWFGLSDPGLEEMLRDRLSFRRFVGLSMDEQTPDETTFVRFRGRLVARGHGSTLFDAVRRVLEQRGVIVNAGTLVDASVQQASRGRWSRAADGGGRVAHAGQGGEQHALVRANPVRLQGAHRHRRARVRARLPLRHGGDAREPALRGTDGGGGEGGVGGQGVLEHRPRRPAHAARGVRRDRQPPRTRAGEADAAAA